MTTTMFILPRGQRALQLPKDVSSASPFILLACIVARADVLTLLLLTNSCGGQRREDIRVSPDVDGRLALQAILGQQGEAPSVSNGNPHKGAVCKPREMAADSTPRRGGQQLWDPHSLTYLGTPEWQCVMLDSPGILSIWMVKVWDLGGQETSPTGCLLCVLHGGACLLLVDEVVSVDVPNSGVKYNGLVTGTRAKGIIAICWVLSFAIGLTPMLGWNNCGQPKEGRNHSQGCREGQVACLFEDVVPMNYMVYFNFFACVLGPLLLMLGVYLRIFLAARRQLKQMESQPLPGERARSTLQKEVHAAKSLAIIVGLFALCWLPLHIINCFTFFCPDCNHAPLWLMYLAIVLSHTNSVVNPFIYAYRIREFRQTFRKIIRSHVLGQQEPFKAAAGTSARALAAHGSDGEQVSLRLNGHPPGVWANGSAPHPERRPNGYALGLVSGGSARESQGDTGLPDVELLSHELKGVYPESPGTEDPLAQDGAGVS
ncbi:Adenosine receptor A2a [Saguinus oedipus]|uniref:Adenosine receptor A2 n=1 Tax=Saguinus oedipus TaxID=9490 RepID=A0ABQ9WKH9_SAGOE|nr:Adenosine receptor A2a [Saguinus oedipus]